MSITFDTNMRLGIEPSEFSHDRGLACVFSSKNQRRGGVEDVQQVGMSSSSFSIGPNSDDLRSSKDDDDDEDDEVDSKYKGTFDSMVDALEEALPIRRGISKFYSGKSKSFASLAEVSSFSAKDIAKPENAFTRRRRNLLNTKYNTWEKKISKRPITTSRSTLALAMAMDGYEDTSGEDSYPSSTTSGSTLCLPPLQHHPPSRLSYDSLASSPSQSPRQNVSSTWRCYSSADLRESDR